jgi:putative transposase
MTNRAHKIALDPTVKQAQYFARACGTARFTWNWGLAEWKRQYEAGEKPSGAALKKQFNAVRHIDFPWSAEVLRDATAQPFANLQAAFTKFFKKQTRFPQFKKKGVHDSFYVANDKFAAVGLRVRIPKLGWVRAREALRFDGKILSAVVSRTAGRWFVSINVDVPEVLSVRENQATVGVDLGIKALATLSTGERFEAPKPLARNLDKLRRLSRQLARKQKGSRNRVKAAGLLARLHYRIACVRADALHKLTTELVRRFGTIVIEDLNVAGMVKNRHLSRAISDLGFGEFERQLAYKAPAAGSSVLKAVRWYPSSKLCSDCGFKVDILPLSIREWTCPECGSVHDRDENAAKNLEQLLAASQEGTPVEMEALARSSGRVKPPSMKQELYRAHTRARER